MELIQIKAASEEAGLAYLNKYYTDINFPTGATAKVFLPDGGSKVFNAKGRLINEDGSVATPDEVKSYIKKAAFKKSLLKLWENPDGLRTTPAFHQICYYKHKQKTIKCSICGENKNIDNFYECKKKQDGYKYGYSSECKECLVVEIDTFSRLFVDKPV